MKLEKSRFNSEAAPQSNACQKDILAVTESDISVIRFEGKKVRIVNCDGNPWFIAKDVCEALELSNHSMAIAALDDDEKGVSLTYTPGGNQNMRTHRFTNWVFREVIPSIRKTGSYGVPFAFLNDHSKRKAAYDKKASKRGKDLQACKGEKSRLIAEEAELWRKYQPQLPEVH